LLISARGLLPKAAKSGGRTVLFVRPSGLVLGVGCLCFVAFLTEGAILDWSGVFLVGARGVNSAGAGLGYAVFSVAMASGRLVGDRIVRALGRRGVLAGGALCAAAGLMLVVTVAQPWVSLVGFAMVGFGAANIVPILYSVLGRQHAMPANLAISTAATLGYAGILAGPALIGWIASQSSLNAGFGFVAALLLLVALSARRVMGDA
jgi:predicted MFS family arabinose efflux permease